MNPSKNDPRRARLEAEIKARDEASRAPQLTDIDRARRAMAEEPQARVSWRSAGKHGPEIAGERAPLRERDSPLGAYGYSKQPQLGIMDDKIGAVMAAVEASEADSAAREAIKDVRVGAPASAVIDPRGVLPAAHRLID